MLGETLGPYRIEAELGSGGMGTVYLAEAISRSAVPVGTHVALKVVHPHLLAEPGFFKRFLREAEIGQVVAHPNVVRCYDCDQLVVDGAARAFLVMEYVEGQTLRDLLGELDQVPEELCRHIGLEVCRGLAAIHEAGVIHRDLKPENILITGDHELKVMDLGLARLADEAFRLSRTGAFVGTVLYGTPEQFAGAEQDGRSDLFALGVILYELASGKHPHPGGDFMRVLARVVEEVPRRLSALNPQVSPFFEEVVHTLLEKDPEKRFPSARALAEVLSRGEDSTWWGRRIETMRRETDRPLRRVRVPRETAVYGREKELAGLRALFAEAKDGSGRAVVLEGEVGIGKSRLVDELAVLLQREGEDFDFLFGAYPPGGAATAASAWTTAVREHLGADRLEEALEDCLSSTLVLVPAFAALLRGEPAPPGCEALTRDSLQTVFVNTFRALSERRPTVILIDDLHFAPAEGRALFASLALALPGQRTLLVGTARPSLPADWRADLERLPQVSFLELSRLGPEDLVKLLTDCLQSIGLAEDLAGRIAVKTEGNPFFVFEIVQDLRERKLLEKGPDGSWATTSRIRDLTIPSSVADLIRARIDALSEEEQELLEVASCCGPRFDPRLVAEVSGLRAVPALRLLGRIEQRTRLVRAAGPMFIFDHLQVQEALYSGISDPLREEYHAGIGKVLLARHPEPDGAMAADLCEHLLRGRLGESALPHLERALNHLRSNYANSRAILVGDLALDTPALLAPSRRVGLLIRKASLLSNFGRIPEAGASTREALRVAEAEGDPALIVRARSALARYHSTRARPGQSLEEYRQAEAVAREAGLTDEADQLAGGLAVACLELNRIEEAREYLERWVEICVKTRDRMNEGRALANLGTANKRLGNHEEARRFYARALEVSRDSGDRVNEAMVTGILGIMLAREGRPMVAREHFERALELTRETGFRAGEGQARAWLGNISRQLGRLEEARAHHERSLALARETADRSGEASELGVLGELHLHLGAFGKAREHLDRYLELAMEIGSPAQIADARLNLAELSFAEGDDDRAREEMETVLELMRERRSHLDIARCLVALGRVHVSSGRPGEAGRCFSEARGPAVEGESPGLTVLAACHLAALTGEDVPSSIALFEEHRSSLEAALQAEACLLLYRATAGHVWLEDAHRVLVRLRKHAPEEYREAMIRNVPLHREILRCWANQR